MQKAQCHCYELTDRLFRIQNLSSTIAEQTFRNKDASRCPCLGSEYPKSATHFQKHDYRPDFSKSFLLTHMQDNRHDILKDFILKRDGYSGKKTPDFASTHYNPCWAFSSMPEMPLLADEFMVDAGIRIPSQLSSSQSTSKIPNLQDIIYRNKRISNVDRSRRCSSYDKGKPARFSADYDDCVKKMPTGCLSNNSQYASQSSDDRSKSCLGGRTRFGFEVNHRKPIDEKAKRNSLIIDKDRLKSLQTKNAMDRNKRHSAGYGMKLPDTKDQKPKFKRHSMEVTDFSPMERNSRVFRIYSTLDVNHNQGSSKIPLRNSQVSGSRTAPVTRSSSPTRGGAELCYEKDNYNDHQSYRQERYLGRFSSSDEEVDKLCQKFLNSQTAPCSRAGSPKSRDSRLPIRLQRRKL